MFEVAIYLRYLKTGLSSYIIDLGKIGNTEYNTEGFSLFLLLVISNDFFANIIRLSVRITEMCLHWTFSDFAISEDYLTIINTTSLKCLLGQEFGHTIANNW